MQTEASDEITTTNPLNSSRQTIELNDLCSTENKVISRDSGQRQADTISPTIGEGLSSTILNNTIEDGTAIARRAGGIVQSVHQNIMANNTLRNQPQLRGGIQGYPSEYTQEGQANTNGDSRPSPINELADVQSTSTISATSPTQTSIPGDRRSSLPDPWELPWELIRQRPPGPDPHTGDEQEFHAQDDREEDPAQDLL